MRISVYAILVSLLLTIVSCAPWQIGAEKNVERNGIAFHTFREQDDGTKLGILAGDTVIDCWPCKQGFVVLYPDWRPDELQLSRDYQRNGISMPAGTWVFPNGQGNPGICMFPHDVDIQGLSCRGSRAGKSGVMTSFHDNGKLKQFFSRETVVVDGVPCNGSVFGSGIHLHENGRLRQCELAEEATVGGEVYQKGRLLQIDPNGKVAHVP